MLHMWIESGLCLLDVNKKSGLITVLETVGVAASILHSTHKCTASAAGVRRRKTMFFFILGHTVSGPPRDVLPNSVHNTDASANDARL